MKIMCYARAMRSNIFETFKCRRATLNVPDSQLEAPKTWALEAPARAGHVAGGSEWCQWTSANFGLTAKAFANFTAESAFCQRFLGSYVVHSPSPTSVLPNVCVSTGALRGAGAYVSQSVDSLLLYPRAPP